MRNPLRARLLVSRLALGCALGATLFSAGGPARAADGEENVPLDTQIIRGFMEQLGLRQDGNGINYEERAPLVIPPKRDLPPPERSGAALAHNPAWPVDPDVTRAKKEAAAKRNTVLNPDAVLLSDQSVLRPDQITPGPKPRSRRIGDDGYRPGPNGSGNQLTPAQLDTKPNFFSRMFGKDAPEITSFTAEPPRVSLVEPPPGYQTPSPDQPYGVGKAKPQVKTSNDYLMDHPVSGY
ncbi:MAG TPA: hypothetical protein VFW22_05805 [Pseudolabrys sp.]|nr:hypothetical protein [Pseudolabrys sp.]